MNWFGLSSFNCISHFVTKLLFALGVATEGMGLVDEWTTAYRVSYSNDSSVEYKVMKDSGNDPKVSSINPLALNPLVALKISRALIG